MTQSSLKDRAAIVTGGGQGIGKAIALRLLQAGARVVLAEIDEEAGQETAAELGAHGSVLFIPTDVADEGSVHDMVARARETYTTIDVLVNNAAVMARKPLTELSLDEWNHVIAVNLTGAFLCARHCTPHLRYSEGAIVNIASTRAFMSEANTESYSAAKGGVVALTHALAMSLGPAVRVNCVSPGWIETGDWRKASTRVEPKHTDADRAQHPAGRVGNPFDVADLVLYLADPAHSFITGQNFTVDGGMTRKMIYVE